LSEKPFDKIYRQFFYLPVTRVLVKSEIYDRMKKL